MARAQGRTRQETSAGGVVVRCGPDGPQVLLILDGHGNWGFPKGHIDPGEDAPAAALREITEETGLEALELGPKLGVIDWWFRWRGSTVHKFCHFFLVESPRGNAAPQGREGIRETRWCALEEAAGLLTHDNARTVLRQAEPLVRARCEAGDA